jgi:hypothetical protein
MAQKERGYYEMSCPRCGKPEILPQHVALNKVPNNKKDALKVKCVLCKRPLGEGK